MESCHSYAVTVYMLICAILVNQVICDWVVEIRLLTFKGDIQECSTSCRTSLRVCVTDSKMVLERNTTGSLSSDAPFEPCKYGEHVSRPMNDNGKGSYEVTDVIVFRSHLPLPTTFGVRMEAWHWVANSSNLGRGSMKRIADVTTVKSSNSNDTWRTFTDEDVNTNSTFRYVLDVKCERAFFGSNCSLMCLDRNNDFGHFTCGPKGERVCMPGWSEPSCTVPICRQDCHPEHGRCSSPGECVCSLGWTGPQCDRCVPLPGCLNGFCRNSSYECICKEGWDGIFCTQPICKTGCHATRGYCSAPGGCSCRLGWSGALCDGCRKLPGCVHGTCDKPFECHCQKGYTGLFCERPACSEGCSPQNGYCRRPDECRCKIGWTGENCDECVPYPGCKNGNCSQPWECFCQPGWGGLRCDEALTYCDDHSPCKNGGTCISRPREDGDYVCYCPENFTGKDCELTNETRSGKFI